MKRSLVKYVLVVGLIAIFQIGLAYGQDRDKYKVEAGKLHDDFELPAVDGKSMVKLSDFKGKKLLLFHFASW